MEIVGYHLYVQLLQTRVPVEELNHLINVILYEWVCHPFLPRANLSWPRGKRPWSEINLLGFASAIPIHDPLTQYWGKVAKWKVFGYGVASQTPKQGLIYGRKHCPTPANLQHISGTPPAILDFLLSKPPFRCEDHLIVWFMVGESTKTPKRRCIKKKSRISRIQHHPGIGITFLGMAASASWGYSPQDIWLRMGDTSTALPRYRRIQVDICCDVYNAPKNIQQ